MRVVYVVLHYLAFYISLIKEGRKQRKYNSAASELLVAIVIALAVETYILNGLFRENVKLSLCIYDWVSGLCIKI